MQNHADRRAIALLLFLSVVAYSYFYQGDGWTLQSHFATIRSLVEHGTFHIAPTFAQTGDVAVIDGRTYSNKPPGLAIVGALPYALISSIERIAGLDLDSRNVELGNQYLLTFLLCGLPAVAINLTLYWWFRRDGAEV